MKEIKLSQKLYIYCTAQLACLGALTLLHSILFSALSYASRTAVLSSIRILTLYVCLSVLFGRLWSEKLNDSFQHIYSKKEVTKILKGVLLMLFGSIILHFFAVLYGAALTEKVEETYHFSLLMSSLLVFPLYLMTNGKWWTVLQITDLSSYFEKTSIDRLKLISLFAVVGALCGSFTLCLDWNRSWKVWPVPCCIGGMFGYMVGLILMTLVAAVEWLMTKTVKKRTKFY